MPSGSVVDLPPRCSRFHRARKLRAHAVILGAVLPAPVLLIYLDVVESRRRLESFLPHFVLHSHLRVHREPRYTAAKGSCTTLYYRTQALARREFSGSTGRYGSK